MLTDFTDHSRF